MCNPQEIKLYCYYYLITIIIIIIIIIIITHPYMSTAQQTFLQISY